MWCDIFPARTIRALDELDVLDGRPASVRKRGYIVEAHRSLVVDGFRQSMGEVAAFRFGPARASSIGGE